MKHLVTLMLVLCCSFGMGIAQLHPMSSVGYATEAPPGYCLSVEEYYVHPEDAGILAGFTTYRVYLNCVNETDFLSACSGAEDNPFILNSSSSLGTTMASIQLECRQFEPRTFGFFRVAVTAI